jgi:hypothetical protein
MGESMTEKYRGHTIEIVQDQFPENPRDDSCLSRIVSFHRRHVIGDLQPKCDPWRWRAENTDLLDGALIRDLYIFDHGNITISTVPFTQQPMYAGDARWDSCQIGWVFVTRAAIITEYGAYNARTKKKAEQVMLAEIDLYDRYLRGDFCGFIIKGELDWSLFGYSDADDALKYAREEIDRFLDHKEQPDAAVSD